MKITVSIVIPAYNSAGTVLETLASVAGQSYDDYEVIIVDDGSIDNTVSVTRRYIDALNDAGRYRLIESDVNSGPAAARNKGVAVAQGEWIAFLDADDAWLPDRLKIEMDLLRKHSDVDMWCGGTVEAYGGVRLVTIEELAVSNPVVTSTVLVRKSVLNDLGGFDEQFCGPEDYDLWMRISAGHRIMKVSRSLCRYRERHGSLSMNDAFLPQVLRVIDKAYAPGGAAFGRRGKRKAIAYRYTSAGWMACDRGKWWKAGRNLLRAIAVWPMPISGIAGHRWMRIKLVLLIWRQVRSDMITMFRMPSIKVNLMLDKAEGCNKFYYDVTRKFLDEALASHSQYPFMRKMGTGVALCPMSDSFDDYFSMIEPSARRNCRKALKKGYEFRRIDFNDHLADIEEIRRSSEFRQGRVTKSLRSSEVKPCVNPVSNSKVHDYPYFGVVGPMTDEQGDECGGGRNEFTMKVGNDGDRKLVAYAGCLVAGDVCMIEHILGHADYHADGVVPLLITEMARYVREKYPSVKYYAYGTFFGAGKTMRRFKRKFCFLPHRVRWQKGKSGSP